MINDAAAESKKRPAAALTIDAGEPPEKRVERLIEESPVVIFSRSSCCMCHVMKRLLAAVGVHPTVIELDEAEEPAAAPVTMMPAMFIGGEPVGGIEGLMALHLSGRLVPRLREETGQVAEKITWMEAGLPAGAYGITSTVFGISATKAGKSERETKVQRDQGLHIFEY
ncbi:hypothetical protein M5K25_024414 [Dendrobium thyrsiflorum]|uniref:Glutaredoxin domain-containing protein n=1 Tax=Dendrobium thyrsiflorum TaxID=117978 RepID=A0ABD0U1U5_DENTH